jgi:hypothetical protein
LSEVDDLFSGDAPIVVRDRLGRASRLLWVALVLQLLGPACFTGVPGAILALVGWQTADDELGRIESGVVSVTAEPRARRLRAFGFGQLVFALLSLSLQIVLFNLGVYDWAIGQVVALL